MQVGILDAVLTSLEGPAPKLALIGADRS